MSDVEEPPRLRDDPELGSVLGSADVDDDPEIVNRVGVRLGFIVGPGTAPPADGAGAATPPASSTGVTLAASVAAVSAVVVGVWWLSASEPRPAAPSSADPSTITPASLETLPSGPAPNLEPVFDRTSEAPAPSEEPAAASTPQERSSTLAQREAHLPEPEPASTIEGAQETEPTDEAEGSRLLEEMQMIEVIRAAVVTEPARALELVRAYRAEFPNGHFHTECDRLERRALTNPE